MALLTKGNQRLYLMERMKPFNACPTLLELFYRSTAESVVTSNSLCHFGSLKEQDKARLSKITKTDCYQADWQTCPRPPGTLRGESSQTPGGHPV